MKSPVTISLSPNTTAKDIGVALKTLLSPWNWTRDTAIQSATEHLADLFPNKKVVLTSSGRQALYDVLRSYNIGYGDEVLIQAFTCIAVPEPIKWVGATPMYVDIDPTSYSTTPEHVRSAITPKTKAIIVQHTFGIPAPIDTIVAIAKEYGIPVIEDCAHALGATYHNQPIGTFGDAAILSFGRDKMISSVFGGAVVCSDMNQWESIKSYARSRSLPPSSWVAQQLMHPILLSLFLPFYFLGIGKVLLVFSQKIGLLSKAVTAEERVGTMPNHIEWKYSPALANLLITQLQSFPQQLKRRHAIAARYMTELADTTITLPHVPTDSVPSWLRYPIQVSQPNDLFAAFKAKHVLLGDWYDAPLAPKNASFKEFGYSEGTAPVAEQVGRGVVNLPTYAKLTDAQVGQIINFVTEYARKGTNK